MSFSKILSKKINQVKNQQSTIMKNSIQNKSFSFELGDSIFKFERLGTRRFLVLIRNNFASFDLRKVDHGAPGRRRSNLGSFELGAPDPMRCIKLA
jgi:hypothetical protein